MGDKKLRRRNEVPVEFKWKLEDMFESDKKWQTEAELVSDMTEEVAQYQDRLAENEKILLEFFDRLDELDYHLQRVYVYANQRHHEDTANAIYQGYSSKAAMLANMAAQATSFVEPEVLSIDDKKLEEFFSKEPKLEKYRRKIEEILRAKEHTLSSAEENILAATGEMAQIPKNVFDMFNNADLKFPYYTDVEGNRIQITHGNFIELLNSNDRSLRKQVFRDVYSLYKKWGNTISATYIGQLKRDCFYAKVRKYESPRQMYLSGSNIPQEVYDNLIEVVHRHLPALHRYMAIRKEKLGVEHLHMYDIYTPIVNCPHKKYSFEDAKLLVQKAMEPMGEDYVSTLVEGMNSGWIDVYENENKRSGAYSWGAYGTHPYVLLNYQDNLDSVFTLAHEMGHAMHTYYSQKKQPITYSDYKIFVAEVASTCNESLLTHYMLENCEDEAEKAYLINHYLESFRTTLFRQTMFAEFEHIVHDKIFSGETLTQEDLNHIYYDLNVMYYGKDMRIDEEIAYEWMRIPHFFSPYYVYQYATGYSAAVTFSKKILNDGQKAVDSYINNFLCGGSSKDPIELLRSAGVDMAKVEPIDKALEVFEEVLDYFSVD